MSDENKKEHKSVMLATKVTPQAARIFERIANRIGVRGYTLLSLMVSAMIQYADDYSECSDDGNKFDRIRDFERMLAIYNHFTNWDKMSSVAGIGKKDIKSAIYLISEDGKRNLNALLVKEPFFDEPEQTWNVQEILDTLLQHAMPHLFKRLMEAGKELECHSTMETISTLVEIHAPDPDGDFIRELFADCNRSEFGRDINLDARYKQKRNKGDQLYLFTKTNK